MNENNEGTATQTPLSSKEELFGKVLDKMFAIYKKKNADYSSGNKSAFEKSYERFGLKSSAVRLGDKYERLCAFAEKETYEVNDESLEDTLLDLANYAVLTLVERLNDAQKQSFG